MRVFFTVHWEYIKQIINLRMKWKPLESCRVQVKKKTFDFLPKIDHLG